MGYEWIKSPEPISLLFDPAAGAKHTLYFQSKMLIPKISLRFAIKDLGLNRWYSAKRPVQQKDLAIQGRFQNPPAGPQDSNQRLNGGQRTCNWLALAVTMAMSPLKVGRFVHRCGSP
jgi:hypothetical protein